MSIRTNVALALLLTAGIGLQGHGAERELPWAFKGKAADGYSIDLVSVDPTPGTPLSPGSEVAFSVSLSYSISIAPHGRIILVFQDEKNGRVASEPAQVSQEVSGPGGTVVLRQTVTIPAHAKELRLFVPLVPDGLTNTSGEVTLRYPIAAKSK